jgi:putative colanic acid biosynthesis UDP-glucose lipid carrier transferase
MKLNLRREFEQSRTAPGMGVAASASTHGRSVHFREAFAANAVSPKVGGINDDYGIYDAEPRLRVSHIVEQSAGFHRLSRSPAKRLFDLVGSALGLAFLAPLLLATAAVIALDSPGPVIFRQSRTGEGGKVFSIYKFRTMTVTENGHTIVQACRSDPRVTRVGHFLRRMSIDELPQLFNVLRGEMSLVGPRPHAVAHDVYYGERVAGYKNRFLAKPGITGLSQVRGLRGPTPSEDCMKLRLNSDMEYIRTWSFALDLKILIKTVFVSLWDVNAY